MGAGHTQAEPFPRQEVARRVGAAERGRAGRERWQGWAFGAALALLALGLPMERVLVTGPTLWSAQGGPQPLPLLGPLARWTAQTLGRPAESPWFLFSALGWGLSLPVLLGALRGVGFPQSVALPAALAALLSPAAWLGATLPHSLGTGILASSLLLAALLGRASSPGTYAARAAALWVLGVLVQPEILMLLPAVAWACARRGSGVGVPLLAAALLLPALWASGHGGLAANAGWPDRRLLLQTLEVLPRAAVGLAFAALGLVALFGPGRAAEESPPPTWLLPWCGAFLLWLLPLRPGGGLHGTFLVPAAAVGLADWMRRRPGGEAARTWAAALLAGQILASAGASAFLRSADPLDGWRASARRHLEPGDLVLSGEADRIYLLRHRWGLAALPCLSAGRPPGGPPSGGWRRASIAAAREGRRVVFAETPEPPPPELPGVEWWVLTAAGVAPLAQAE